MYTNRADQFASAQARAGRIDNLGSVGFDIDWRLVAEFEAQLQAAMAEPDPIAMAGDGGPVILEAKLTATGVNAQFPIMPNVRRALKDTQAFGQLLSEAVWKVEGCDFDLN